MSYVELHACSAFSFLRGGSFPEQLAETAAELEMPAMALLDHNGVYGAQRFSVAAREHNVRPIVGCELSIDDGSVLPVLVENRDGYRNLCELLTQAHLRSEKGKCAVQWNELAQFAKGLIALFNASFANCRASMSDAKFSQRFTEWSRGDASAMDERVEKPSERDRESQTPDKPIKILIDTFGRENVFVELQRHFIRGEERVNRELIHLAGAYRLALLATNGVKYAKPYGREVLDVFTCIREHTHLDAAGKLLAQNAECHLKSDRQMRAIFADLPQAIENTSLLAERLTFSLENLGYEFPEYPVPAGHTMDSFLRTIVWFGAQQRYAAISTKVKHQLEEELALITKLGFPGYFLIVWDIVNFCREHNIMVQGRGSAANSAVCYCLGITPVDPVENHLVFERFLNESRKGWPDIDLDLPSGDRREAVIQEIYRRYGKHGAAMTANVISYRGPQRGSRDRQGAQFFSEHHRSFFPSVCEWRFPTHARARIADRAGWFAEKPSAHAGIHQTVSRNLWIAAAPRPAFRWHDYLSEQAQFVCAAGKRFNAGACGCPMGQGRLRRSRHREGGLVRPRHDVGDAGRV